MDPGIDPAGTCRRAPPLPISDHESLRGPGIRGVRPRRAPAQLLAGPATADVATGDPVGESTLVVSGAITMCSTEGEGGEGFAYGAGGKVFDGEKEVGEFRAYHLCEYGMWTMGVDGRGDTCMDWVANVIASTIIEGNFAEATAAAIEAEQRAYGIELASEQQAEAVRRAQSMIITAGPITQQYAIQGPISFDTIGYINYGALLHDALFVSRFERAVRGPTPTANINQAFNGLRYKAAMRYPDANAVINATYHVDKNGTVFANGLAVQITGAGVVGQPVPAQRATDERLRAAKSLLDQGLITQKEYDAKRAEILDDL